MFRFSPVFALGLLACSSSAPSVHIELTPPATGGPFYADIDIDITGTVSDASDDISDLEVFMRSSTTGDLDGWDIEVSFGGTISGTGRLEVGEQELQLVALNSIEKEGVAGSRIVVQAPNSPPECAFVAPLASDVLDPNIPSTLTARVSDADIGGDALTIEFTSDIDGDLGSATATDGLATTSAMLSPALQTLTVTATDELGEECVAQVQVVVGLPPEIAFLTGDLFFNEEERVELGVQVSDDLDAPLDLRVRFESDIDGLLATTTPREEGDSYIARTDMSVGDHIITATVFDSHGLSASASIDVTINDLPTAPSVQVAPNPADTTQDLVATLVSPGSDAEGDEITHSYRWLRDGIDVGQSGQTLASAYTRKGQTWRVHVVASDPYGSGPEASAGAVVLNSIPEITSVSISPASPSASDTITCSIDGSSDLDGDAITYTYEWAINGTATADIGSFVSSGYGRDDLVACTVTPDDGEVSGAAVSSSSVTVVNSTPGEPTVVVTPSSPVESNDLLCEIETESSDADGDTITYTISWELDGVSWTGSTSSTTLTDDTISSADTAEDDVWQCFALPNDGVADGPEGSSPATTIAGAFVTHSILYADLDNLGSNCSTVANESMYTCSGDWGFTWSDSGTDTPTAVTVEMYHGIWCSTSSSKSPELNGVAAGTFSLTGGDCYCDPSVSEHEWELTDISGYNVGGSNTFEIPIGSSCEGLTINSSWGTGVYAQVTVSY